MTANGWISTFLLWRDLMLLRRPFNWERAISRPIAITETHNHVYQASKMLIERGRKRIQPSHPRQVIVKRISWGRFLDAEWHYRESKTLGTLELQQRIL